MAVLDFLKKQGQKPKQETNETKQDGKQEASKPEGSSPSLPILVFPEAKNPNILKAAVLLSQKKKCIPVLVGNKKEIETAASAAKVKIEGIAIRDPAADDAYEEASNELFEANDDKIDLTKAKELALEPLYFSLLLARKGLAHGVVVGASTASSGIFKPVLQVFPEASKSLSSFHVLSKGNYTVVFSDCAMSASPSADRLAEIARDTAANALSLSGNARVALVSFSTLGSSQHPDAQKVRDALKKLKVIAKDVSCVGEVQFDVAVNPVIAKKKVVDGSVEGNANVIIFPDLDSANIALKVAEQFGQFETLGPFTQGLSAPLGTIGEDASPDDIYRTAQVVLLLAGKRLNTASPSTKPETKPEE